MKKILSIFLTVCMAFSLVGCSTNGEVTQDGNNADNSETIDETTENAQIDNGVVGLNFVQSFAEGEDISYLQTLIDEFNTIDPEIQVNLISVPEDEILEYILDENNKSDIFSVNSYHTTDLYNADKLASLDSYMAQAISLDVTGIEQDIHNLEYYITEYSPDAFTEINGTTYSVPLFRDTSVLFFNSKIIGPTGSYTMITNFPGLIEISAWGTDLDLDYYGMSLLLTNKEPIKSATNTILPILYANDGSLMQGDVFTVNTPEMLKAMQLIETLGIEGYVMPQTSQKTTEEVFNDFTDKITILLIGSLEDNYLPNASDLVYREQIGTHNLNSDFSNRIIDNSINVAISEDCNNKDAAFEFIKYITYKNRAMGVELGKYAVTSASSESPYQRVYETKLLPHAQECLTELTKAGVAVLDGEKAPEQALLDCQEEWDRILGQ